MIPRTLSDARKEIFQRENLTSPKRQRAFDQSDCFQTLHIYLLDTRTGEILGYESDIEERLLTGGDLSDLAEWRQGEIAAARRVLRASGELLDSGEEADQISEPGRYVEIPRIETDEAYETMADFAETVRNAHLRELLDVALRGKGAFRRFKDVLLGYPAERDRWFEFEERRKRETIEEWAHEQGVEINMKRTAVIV